MADPNHPRRFTDDFKSQIVDFYNGGEPVGEIMADYDLGRSTADEADVPNIVNRERFSTLRELQAKLNDYVNWYNNFRLHSTFGYMSPVEFRLAGLTL